MELRQPLCHREEIGLRAKANSLRMKELKSGNNGNSEAPTEFLT